MVPTAKLETHMILEAYHPQPVTEASSPLTEMVAALRTAQKAKADASMEVRYRQEQITEYCVANGLTQFLTIDWNALERIS